MNTPLISFVIPVYNGERYIRETVERIVLASRVDGAEKVPFEIICVDDCCTDSSPAILDDLASAHESVQVIHKQKNENVGAARNTAIDAARGDWICCIDSDDILNSRAFEVFSRLMGEGTLCSRDSMGVNAATCDIVYFLYDQFTVKPPEKEVLPAHLKKHVFGEAEIREQQAEILTRRKIRNKPYNFRTLAYVWGKLYRREFLKQNGIRFVESMRYEEDLSFNFMCLARCNRSMLVDFPLVHYRYHQVSYTHGYVDGYWKKITDTIPVYRSIIGKFYAGDDRIEKLFHYRILWQLLFSELRGPCHHANPESFGVRKREFFEILSREEYRGVFSHVKISSLGFPNSLLAFGVKHRSLLFCQVLERILQLKNRLANLVG